MTFPGSARTETVLNTSVNVDIRTALPQRELVPMLDNAFAWLRWVDRTFDPFDEESQIGRLNAGRTIEQVPELIEVLHRCDEMSEATDGWFDSRIGGALDVSGYIKGWAVERLSRALAGAGAVDHRITAGTDIRVRGSSLPGRPWRVGIRDPRTNAVRRMVFANDLAISTSGHTRVVDPRTGEAQHGLSSVTVLGPDLATADAFATAMYAMGPARARRFAQDLAAAEPYEVMLVTRAGRSVSTPGFALYGTPSQLAG
ncbi:FAD:protein FMN transferase [Nonomuraea sp. NPDC050790]|uniref:FAD:protein FMN transferase n=1 Tax=Nonomuraea sp. NPDC050790 TaxID=3364371 RepID=UPI00379DB82F